MIVPYPPGGSTDPTGRAFAAWISEALGQQVVVDNRPGAGATIGHGLGAKETADGGAGFRAPWRVDATRKRAVARR